MNSVNLRTWNPSRLFSLVFLLFILSACSRLNCTRLEPLLGGQINLVTFSYKVADSLLEKTLPPLIPYHPEMPVLVTTFVDNNDLEKTNQFGRQLQEHISSRISQHGYTVKEFKLGGILEIEKRSGETILSRDLNKIDVQQTAQAILVGTFSRSDRILYISTRLVHPVNKNILASEDYRICMDDHLLKMFGLRRSKENETIIKEPEKPFSLNVFM